MTETDFPSRRLKAYAFSANLIVQMFRTGRIYGAEPGYDRLEILDGFPEGAEVVSAEYDQLARAFVVVVEHESFPQVSEAVETPQNRITWKWHELPQGSVTSKEILDD